MSAKMTNGSHSYERNAFGISVADSVLQNNYEIRHTIYEPR